MNQASKQILRSLLDSPKSFWQLIRDQNSHLARYTGTLTSLVAQGLIREKNHLFELTEKGYDAARRKGLISLTNVTCPQCAGRGVSFSSFFQNVADEFYRIAAARPRAIPEFDQGFIESEITVARTVLMYARGDLEGQRIIILGDDDLTSIALALTGLPKEIAVLEIDERILNFIGQVARDRNWHHLKLYKYDVRESFPAHLSGQYDAFFTDPVETLPGFRLFLSRCTEALKGQESVGYLGLTHLEASRQKWYSFQKMFLEMGFVITDLIYNFHSYDLERTTFIKQNYPVIEASPFDLEVPEINWYTSNLIRLEAVEEPKPLTRRAVHLGRDLYFDDEAQATLPSHD